jgi:hypothetical protein
LLLRDCPEHDGIRNADAQSITPIHPQIKDDPMRVAGIQISAGPDIDRNVQRSIEMAEVAAERDAKIICYPELFLHPWFPKQEDKAYFSSALS